MTQEAPVILVDSGLKPRDSLRWLNRHKIILLSFTVAGAVVAGGIASTLPRSYQASGVLRPVITEMNGNALQSSMLGSLGGLGGVAGALLGGGARTADDSTATIAYMQSPDFIRAFIESENLMPQLFPDAWDAQRSAWVGEQPEMEDAIRAFREKVRISREEDGLVTFDFRWSNPADAQRLAKAYIARVNIIRRNQALVKAKANLGYLEKRLGQEPVQEMRQTTAGLASNELVRIMLAEGPGQYALETVVPPFASRIPVSPPRTLLALGGGLLGLVAAILYLTLRRRPVVGEAGAVRAE